MESQIKENEMPKLIVTMGISGSGKSRYATGLATWIYESKNILVRVCMDDLRKLYTGDISNQTQNQRVADNAFVIAEFLLFKGHHVIFDSTATRPDTRLRLLKIAEKQKAETELVVFMDSLNVDLCRNRVLRDIQERMDRADTSRDISIIDRQFNAFEEDIKFIHGESWDKITEIRGL
jgi:predicted kinase